jgi:hypothetical protein
VFWVDGEIEIENVACCGDGCYSGRDRIAWQRTLKRCCLKPSKVNYLQRSIDPVVNMPQQV